MFTHMPRQDFLSAHLVISALRPLPPSPSRTCGSQVVVGKTSEQPSHLCLRQCTAPEHTGIFPFLTSKSLPPGPLRRCHELTRVGTPHGVSEAPGWFCGTTRLRTHRPSERWCVGAARTDSTRHSGAWHLRKASLFCLEPPGGPRTPGRCREGPSALFCPLNARSVSLPSKEPL